MLYVLRVRQEQSIELVYMVFITDCADFYWLSLSEKVDVRRC
jgi:hypothetical protein